MDWIFSVLVPLAVGLVPAILTYLAGRRRARGEETKLRANAAATLPSAAATLVDQLPTEIDGLRETGDMLAKEMSRLRERIVGLERENKRLRDENATLAAAFSKRRDGPVLPSSLGGV